MRIIFQVSIVLFCLFPLFAQAQPSPQTAPGYAVNAPWAGVYDTPVPTNFQPETGAEIGNYLREAQRALEAGQNEQLAPETPEQIEANQQAMARARAKADATYWKTLRAEMQKP